MKASRPRKLVRGLLWVTVCAGLIFMVLPWLFHWPGALVAVLGVVLAGVVGWVCWFGHLDSEDERLLTMLLAEPGMPSDQFRVASGLGPDEYALALHRLKDGWWIEWGWGRYHLTPRARLHFDRTRARVESPS